MSFNEILKSDIVGLIFILILFIFTGVFWYWVMFRNGTERWKDGIISFAKQMGTHIDSNDYMVRPITLKIASSILFIGSIFGILLAVVSIFKK